MDSIILNTLLCAATAMLSWSYSKHVPSYGFFYNHMFRLNCLLYAYIHTYVYRVHNIAFQQVLLKYANRWYCGKDIPIRQPHDILGYVNNLCNIFLPALLQ